MHLDCVFVCAALLVADLLLSPSLPLSSTRSAQNPTHRGFACYVVKLLLLFGFFEKWQREGDRSQRHKTNSHGWLRLIWATVLFMKSVVLGQPHLSWRVRKELQRLLCLGLFICQDQWPCKHRSKIYGTTFLRPHLHSRNTECNQAWKHLDHGPTFLFFHANIGLRQIAVPSLTVSVSGLTQLMDHSMWISINWANWGKWPRSEGVWGQFLKENNRPKLNRGSLILSDNFFFSISMPSCNIQHSSYILFLMRIYLQKAFDIWCEWFINSQGRMIYDLKMSVTWKITPENRLLFFSSLSLTMLFSSIFC